MFPRFAVSRALLLYLYGSIFRLTRRYVLCSPLCLSDHCTVLVYLCVQYQYYATLLHFSSIGHSRQKALSRSAM